MQSLTRSKPQLIIGLGVVVAVAAAAAYFATRSPGQAQVSADALPLAAGVHRAAAYVDCSQINALDFDPHTPCETFVLLEGNHFASAALLQNAEAHELSVSGWRHSAAQPVDYDEGGAMASPSERWALADRHVCAYVATAKIGVAAEAKGLFPYDPWNQPRGVLDFYLKAKAAQRVPALWVRIRAAC